MANSIVKVSLMRAARTDAGVSAAINVLNLKLILKPSSLSTDTSLEEHINTFLPTAIRVWAIIRVQGGFHARTMCDSRMYNYSLPTYCFLEPKEESLMGRKITWKQGEKEHGYWKHPPPSVAKPALDLGSILKDQNERMTAVSNARLLK